MKNHYCVIFCLNCGERIAVSAEAPKQALFCSRDCMDEHEFPIEAEEPK